MSRESVRKISWAAIEDFTYRVRGGAFWHNSAAPVHVRELRPARLLISHRHWQVPFEVGFGSLPPSRVPEALDGKNTVPLRDPLNLITSPTTVCHCQHHDRRSANQFETIRSIDASNYPKILDILSHRCFSHFPPLPNRSLAETPREIINICPSFYSCTRF